MTMASPTANTLANLTAELGVPSPGEHIEEGSGKSSSMTASLLVCEEDDECDFSSFPSLSLAESTGNFHRGIFTSRGEVESHVESLLSRPILLGKQVDSVEETESDSLDEFVVKSFDEVPQLMLSNFCSSFSTLMNSRLRAYASFLARHALTLASEHEDEGANGIEQKLEAMLGIGRQITFASSSSEFSIDKKSLLQGPKDTASESGMTCDELPVKMNIVIEILLPQGTREGDSMSMTASFKASGKICGIFSLDDNSVLRVAEVTLNMHELLTHMTEEASRVISLIVEIANTAYAVPLPTTKEGVEHEFCKAEEATKRKGVSWSEEASEIATIVSLSQEKCANIVDFVMGELSEQVFCPPATKKLKIV